jgi:hypothetical protein
LFFSIEGTPKEIKEKLGSITTVSVLVDVSTSEEIKGNINRIIPGIDCYFFILFYFICIVFFFRKCN